MKRVYLIHGWGGSSNGGWFDWLKEEFKKRNIESYAFDMPDTNNPKIELWVGFLKKNVKKIDKETYFIGHSIGCQTIMRFLEKLNNDKKIGGVIFVAGWFNLTNEALPSEEDREIAEPWINTKINFNKIKKHTKNFLAIFSDNDSLVPLSDSKIFEKELNAKITIMPNQGHFDNTEKIQEVLEFIR